MNKSFWLQMDLNFKSPAGLWLTGHIFADIFYAAKRNEQYGVLELVKPIVEFIDLCDMLLEETRRLTPEEEDAEYARMDRTDEICDAVFFVLTDSLYKPMKNLLYVLFQLIIKFGENINGFTRTDKPVVISNKRIDPGIELFIDVCDMLLEEEVEAEDQDVKHDG